MTFKLPSFLLNQLRRNQGGLTLAAVLTLLAAPAAWAQIDSLRLFSGQFDKYSQQTLTEKLYLHLDRPAYVVGETMWFKAYAVDGTFHRPLPMSKVAYVEVLDEARRPVLQGKIALAQATGQGSFVLPLTLASGRYTVRAYTSWMQNFSPDYYFQSPVTILNTARAAVAKPVAGEKSSPAYDIQFFPEGGTLVQGLPGRVAFKVMNKAGHSLAVTGTVLDARGQAVATFRSLKFGMGSFALSPQEAGAAYSAVVKLPDNSSVSVTLPAVQPSGYVLSLTETGSAALRLSVQASADLATGLLYLLAHSGQKVAVAVTARLVDGRATFDLNKSSLLAGISHFTVFNGQRQPVAERLYFRPGRPRAAVVARVDKASYGPREKVSLQLSSSKAAAVSVAVYQLDSLSATRPADMGGYLQLASELRGFIESPDYYFQDSSAVGREVADNLMLTQGWRRFRWDEVLGGKTPAIEHLPELNGPVLRGRLTSLATGAPAPGISTYLTAVGRSGRFYHAKSQVGGLLQYELNPFFGTQKLVLQTNPTRDSTYRVELLSPFSPQFSTLGPVPLATAALPAGPVAERHLQSQVYKAYFGKSPAQFKPLAPDTAAFYGRPDERYRLDDYTRFRVMEEVMREYVAGVMVRKKQDEFRFIVLNRVNHTFFQNNPMVLLDGVPVFDINQIMAFDPLKVKQIDVLAARYFQGSQTYEGMVSYTTYNGDLGGLTLNPRALLEEYEGLQSQREFYSPRYETSQGKHGRLPDPRNLLYWNPSVTLNAGGSAPLEFYTSDQAGRYVVVTQGLAADGPLGAGTTVFEARPAL